MSDETNKDGGPAFPGGSLPEHPHTPNGMTLRDWFAGQALAGYAAKYGCPDDSYDALLNDSLACYAIADAMLAARDKD